MMANGIANQIQGLRDDLYRQYRDMSRQQGSNQYFQRAGQQLQQPPQQPALWGSVEQRLGQILAPGYSAYSPQESDARYQAMQQRINKAYDQQSRALSESLNQRGLYRTGLYDQLQHQMVEDPRQQALAQAAMDVYISGQDATRQAIQNAMAMALGLGGQQAGLQQQYLQNLLGMGQLQNQLSLQPFQMGLNLWNAIYGPEQTQRNQATASAFQSIGNLMGSILPWLFFF